MIGFMLILSMCSIGCETLKYNGDSNGFTAIPNDIPNDATEISLQKNQISEINSIEILPKLLKIYLSYNDLMEIPNLDNVGPTLIFLDIRYNKLTLVNTTRLEQLVVLRNLDLTGNTLLVGLTDESFVLPSLHAVSLGDTGFKEWPYYLSILNNLLSVAFSYNTFTINYIQPMPVFKLWFSHGNFGPVFPDLSNISTTLKELYVTDCNLVEIPHERLASLRILSMLDISLNPLSIIPDPHGMSLQSLIMTSTRFQEVPNLTNLGQTLEHLFIGGTDQQYKRISTQWLSTLSHLTELYLDDAPLEELPDFTHYNTTGRIVTISVGGSFSCDGSMIKLKLAEVSGVVSVSSQPSCSTPAELIGQTAHDDNIKLMMKGL